MTLFFRNLSLFSYFGLMITLICWITLGEHSSNYPTSAWLLIALVPLLFPLKGFLHGKPYTHAWTTFLMFFYFSHGIGEVYSAQGIDFYASLEVLFSFIVFTSSITFIRFNAKSKKKLSE